MKTTEFRKLIREEVRKVLSEAVSWDKQSIDDFFTYLKRIGVIDKAMPKYMSDTAGRIELTIGGMSTYEAKFIVNGDMLVFTETNNSDFPTEFLVGDIENLVSRLMYNITSNGNKMIVKFI